MPRDLPCGLYNLDHQLITASCFQLLNNGSENESIKKSDSTVQVHYVVEGTEEIHLIHWNSVSIGQNQGNAQLIGSPKLKIKQNSGEFLILFPSDPYFGRTSSFRGQHFKKIIVSIPIQRVM
jgi:beta-galactosidase beta subunit